MRRRLSNAVCLLSLMLAVAVAGLWVRTYSVHDFVWYGRNTGELDRLGVITSWGTIGFFEDRGTDWPRGDNQLHYSHWPASYSTFGSSSSHPPHMSVYLDRFGFLFRTDRSVGYLRGWDMAVPHWFFLLMFAVQPTRWLLIRLRAPRSVRSCTTCGYDLRGSPGGACPECGEPVPAPPAGARPAE